MTNSTTFAAGCRRYAELIRKPATAAKQGESQESLRKFAEELGEIDQKPPLTGTKPIKQLSVNPAPKASS